MGKRSPRELWEDSECVACRCPLSPRAAADQFGFITMPQRSLAWAVGTGLGTLLMRVLSPATLDAPNAAPKACFCLLIVFTCNAASGHLRTSVADWLENSVNKRKKNHQ